MEVGALVILFFWSIVEMGLLPIPTDLLVVPLVASENLNPLIVATVGAVGSIFGGLIDYYLGRFAFMALDSKFSIAMRVEKVKLRFKRVANYGFPGLLILGRLIPFMVLKPVMVLAGGVKYDTRIFILVIFVASFVRYFADATVGSVLSLLTHL